MVVLFKDCGTYVACLQQKLKQNI